jgi:hypothetical protein
MWLHSPDPDFRTKARYRLQNPALLPFAYARAAAAHYGIDRFSEREWRALEEERLSLLDPEPIRTKPKITWKQSDYWKEVT